MKCPFCIKYCSKCKRLLVAYRGNFHKQKNGKYGLRSQCKVCKRKYNQSEKGKESERKSYAKYYKSEKGKKAINRYKQSEKGKQTQRKINQKHWDKYLEENGLERGQGSIGEQKVRQVLNERNISFVEQHTFNDCKFKHTLPFDFYIPSLNTIIEYDGEQHFEAVQGWGGEEHLKETQERDTIKNDYCRRNNIRLIRIPYWEQENIEQILSDLL